MLSPARRNPIPNASPASVNQTPGSWATYPATPISVDPTHNAHTARGSAAPRHAPTDRTVNPIESVDAPTTYMSTPPSVPSGPTMLPVPANARTNPTNPIPPLRSRTYA